MSIVGLGGYSWSSSVSDTNSTYLRFRATDLYPCYTTGRIHGFQLRCLSE
ncbi:hypothetical protein [uncultured Rikenella sp.]|nr:hypothetical protein [uncultured Rikenella sp.]